MEKFKSITGKVIPIPLRDIDTDVIYPAQALTTISRTGHEKNLFKRLREQDPQFPLNLPKYNSAPILVADSNFGCGSSREHAVWALLDAGIKVVISKSFADIFYSNSAKNGLILVTLPEGIVDDLLNEAQLDNLTLTVDLKNRKVTKSSGEIFKFSYDPFRKHCILKWP